MVFASQERAAMAAASDPYRYVEKRKPIPDPQVYHSNKLQVAIRFISDLSLCLYLCIDFQFFWFHGFSGNRSGVRKQE